MFSLFLLVSEMEIHSFYVFFLFGNDDFSLNFYYPRNDADFIYHVLEKTLVRIDKDFVYAAIYFLANSWRKY